MVVTRLSRSSTARRRRRPSGHGSASAMRSCSRAALQQEVEQTYPHRVRRSAAQRRFGLVGASPVIDRGSRVPTWAAWSTSSSSPASQRGSSPRVAGAGVVGRRQRREAARDDAAVCPVSSASSVMTTSVESPPRTRPRVSASGTKAWGGGPTVSTRRLVRAVPMPGEEHPATGTKVDLGFVAEPAGEVLRLGHDRPDDARRRVDEDLPLDGVRNHGENATTMCNLGLRRQSGICNHWVAQQPITEQEPALTTSASKDLIAVLQMTLDGRILNADGRSDWVDSWADGLELLPASTGSFSAQACSRDTSSSGRRCGRPGARG